MIILSEISKQFNFKPILKHISLEIQSNEKYVIIGRNGSGKSTLLKIIAGYIKPDSGKISNSFKNFSFGFSSPYLSLFDYLTVDEIVNMHISIIKKPVNQDIYQLMLLSPLWNHKHKIVKSLSSGLLQRLKNYLALLLIHDVILLDEPTSNLDEFGKTEYEQMISKIKSSSLILASNDAFEYKSFSNIFEINNQTLIKKTC